MKLLAAFFTDLTIGDPEWIPTPHPVVLIGKAITTCKNKIISVIYGHSFKAVLEKSTEVTPVLSNALYPIYSNEDGKVKDTGIALQLWKALPPMLRKCSKEDKSISCNLVQ